MAMRRYIMHMTQQTFEEIGEGLVRVTNRDGRTGIFTSDGRWVEGELKDANTNMLVYTGGPNMPSDFQYRWLNVPADTERSSGWPECHEKQLASAGILSTSPITKTRAGL